MIQTLNKDDSCERNVGTIAGSGICHLDQRHLASSGIPTLSDQFYAYDFTNNVNKLCTC